MAQRHPDPTTASGAGVPPQAAPAPDGPTAASALAPHLREQATRFLRTLRALRDGEPYAVPALRETSYGLACALHTFGPVLAPAWAAPLHTELTWLSAALDREPACATRLDRLLAALHRLTGAAGEPGREPAAAAPAARGGAGPLLPVGAARAAALLERQHTLARTRAHSAALETLRSTRFHAVADSIAVLVGEVPLVRPDGPLAPLAAEAGDRLSAAVDALPAPGDGHAYDEAQDTAWDLLHPLLGLHRHAQEVLVTGRDRADVRTDALLAWAAHALDAHREAAEAAAAAATAARTPRIAPATAYALGVLHADQRHEVETARGDFRRAWVRTAVPAPVL